jgi:hypothetical protein
MSKSKWKDPSLDQTGRPYPTPGMGGGRARPNTGSGNKQQFIDQTRQADGEFKQTTKHAQRRQRH